MISRKNRKSRPKWRGFMCATNFLHEADGGFTVKVYPMESECLKTCAKDCGMVEVEVSLVRTVLECAQIDFTE